jgi:type I restriction enzyme S subunit
MSHYKPYPAYKDSGVEWLGQVPEHWVQVPLKRLVRSIEQGWSPECESWPAEEGGWGVVKVGCVNGGHFRPEENKALPVSLEPRPGLSLREGDVLVSRANTRELVGSCVAVPQSYPNLLLCDKIYRIRCGELVTPSFLAALITVHGRRAVEIEATGASSSMLNISQSVILDLPVALPEPTEQDQIIAAASRETARIDALVAKKTRFIELLREKRQALITHAVTKGLDPNVKMKDSGVEWLGEVPEHWDVLSFQRCVFIAEGQVNPEKSPYREMILLAPNHIESGSGLLLYTETAEEQSAESGKYLCEKGDVVYSKIRPALRKVCMAPEVSLCSADMYPMRGHSGMSNQFLFWFLLSEPFSAFAVLEADRVAMPKINRESLNSLHLPRPPFSEQMEIVARLSQVTVRLDSLRAKTERSIEFLKERRTALITAAVTGQIDLRESA